MPSHQHSGSHAHAQCHDGTRCGEPAPDVTVSDTTRERPRFKSNNPFNQFLRQPSSYQIPHRDHDAVQIRGSAPSSTAPHWAAPLNMSESPSLMRYYAPREREKVLDDVMYQRIGVEPGLECDELLRLQTVPRLPTGTGIPVLPCPICRCGCQYLLAHPKKKTHVSRIDILSPVPFRWDSCQPLRVVDQSCTPSVHDAAEPSLCFESDASPWGHLDTAVTAVPVRTLLSRYTLSRDPSTTPSTLVGQSRVFRVSDLHCPQHALPFCDYCSNRNRRNLLSPSLSFQILAALLVQALVLIVVVPMNSCL